MLAVAALTIAEAVKILTGKGKVKYCPHVFQIDLLTQKVEQRYYPWGMRSPWLRFKRKIIGMFLEKQSYHLLYPEKLPVSKTSSYFRK